MHIHVFILITINFIIIKKSQLYEYNVLKRGSFDSKHDSVPTTTLAAETYQTEGHLLFHVLTLSLEKPLI
jgi:hypothetical protein